MSRTKFARTRPSPRTSWTPQPAGIAIAALKYGDLSNLATKDYIFDLERFAAFEGNTGPYLLYTIVRIKSILNRCGGEGDWAMAPADSESAKALQLEPGADARTPCRWPTATPHRT